MINQKKIAELSFTVFLEAKGEVLVLSDQQAKYQPKEKRGNSGEGEPIDRRAKQTHNVHSFVLQGCFFSLQGPKEDCWGIKAQRGGHARAGIHKTQA